eukprot:comp17672_c0_seq1/m.17481 comp17672_c0_seq1/g.17481  ORF comp17672_c0_seq1/g.17481 comp17672_c0_seq1/m.17481 type:complete len:201 (-) comp17672_c0_seq1:485-1087(-)
MSLFSMRCSSSYLFRHTQGWVPFWVSAGSALCKRGVNMTSRWYSTDSGNGENGFDLQGELGRISERLDGNRTALRRRMGLSKMGMGAAKNDNTLLPNKGLARIAVATIRPGRMAEAVDLYESHIKPAYALTPGFRGSFLLHDSESNTLQSVTAWVNQEALDANNSNDAYREAMQRLALLLQEPPTNSTMQVCAMAPLTDQ